MEKHGVTFKDYALANANLANGMPIEKVCEVLGVEEPIWAEVSEYMINNMSQLDPGGEEIMFFSTVFTNPKQGKFANIEDAAGGVEDVLEKYSEWSDFIKIQQHIDVAAQNGIDLDIDKEYGISILQFSQLGSHWSAMYKEKVMDVENFDSYAYEEEGGPAITPEQEERFRIFNLHTDLMNKWEAHFKEMYKDASTDLSDDIDF